MSQPITAIEARLALDRSPVEREVAAFESSVTVLAELETSAAEALLGRYGVRLVTVARGREIPGSYWGESEAGLIENDVFARADTPVHSLLHELGHFVCMDAARRARLATDAGGSDDEECGVCYLQVLLADALTGYGRARCFADMDEWGYSFREGSAERWFRGDGESARAWLLAHGLIDEHSRPTLKLRESAGA
jgi:hypothetical protein